MLLSGEVVWCDSSGYFPDTYWAKLEMVGGVTETKVEVVDEVPRLPVVVQGAGDGSVHAVPAAGASDRADGVVPGNAPDLGVRRVGPADDAAG